MKTVLIVDDHAEIRRLLRMTLEGEDLALHEADSGAAAWTAAQAQRPDVVLMDVMMPGGLDGLEVCRRIRACPSLAHTQVVMLSARDSTQDRAAGLLAGACSYIAKPFSTAQIAETVRRLGACAPAPGH
ncbi:response regulator [Acidovorax sp. GBBC 3334]|uniref:response regulator transcription factor n=1 Tax=unclassified Acidovorax TaxID=2684926 RepID=UPI002304ABD3|nr:MULTISPECIES: response regulator [unclassified Acidovorax]MDA8455366.1 response regulator [Acidovorax sp. GBBC 3334]MDA8521437.1 response regulator [Acidovorax sp. NCPPB 4044]